jgi:hypothetical protein
MKTIYTLLILLMISSTSIGQTYRIYTAKQNGDFGHASTWSAVLRNDNVKLHTYIIPASYTVTADKYTDYSALGDIEIVVAGKLKMGAGAEMSLTNNSSIRLISGAFVEGNGGSQKILIGGITKYQGNTDKSIQGPLFADKTTIGFSLFTTLSVEFLSFTASKYTENTISLKWSTATEMNNSHFEIECSSNGKDWSKIGVIHAAANGNRTNNYSFLHDVKGSASYRIKQVDKDGKFDYSDVAVIKNHLSGMAIYTAKKTVNVEVPASIKHLVVKILNTNGQVLKSETFPQVNGKVSVNVSGLTNGNYIVHVSDNSTLHTAKSVMIF